MESIFASLIAGGGTGILGTFLSGLVKYFSVKQQHKYEIEKTEMELKVMAAEAEHAVNLATIEAESAEKKAEWEGLQASYVEATKRLSTGNHPALIWVDVVRGLMRPLLTLSLVILVAVIYFTNTTNGYVEPSSIVELCTEGVDLTACLKGQEVLAQQNQRTELNLRIVSTILYLATAAVLWWFGSRQVEKAIKLK